MDLIIWPEIYPKNMFLKVFRLTSIRICGMYDTVFESFVCSGSMPGLHFSSLLSFSLAYLSTLPVLAIIMPFYSMLVGLFNNSTTGMGQTLRIPSHKVSQKLSIAPIPIENASQKWVKSASRADLTSQKKWHKTKRYKNRVLTSQFLGREKCLRMELEWAEWGVSEADMGQMGSKLGANRAQ